MKRLNIEDSYRLYIDYGNDKKPILFSVYNLGYELIILDEDCYGLYIISNIEDFDLFVKRVDESISKEHKEYYFTNDEGKNIMLYYDDNIVVKNRGKFKFK